MPSLTMIDAANRMTPVAEKKRWVAKKAFKPGGEKGKLHRELGVAEGEKIPAGKLAEAEHSKNPEIKRDAGRAKTMMGWRHSGGGKSTSPIYSGRGKKD